MQGLLYPSVRAPASQKAVWIQAALWYGSWWAARPARRGPDRSRTPCDGGSVTGGAARKAGRENPLPNTRLKLTAPGLWEELRLCPGVLRVSLNLHWRRRDSAPQLKRIPLGGTTCCRSKGGTILSGFLILM